MNDTSLPQAIHDRCKDLGLSFAHAQRLAAENDHTDPQSLLWVLGLDLATLAPLKPRRWLWMAGLTSSVSYCETLTQEALLAIFTTGEVPAAFVPHVGHLLDEAPIQLMVMAVEQAAQQSSIPIDAIWRNVERIAGMWSQRQTLWMVSANDSVGEMSNFAVSRPARCEALRKIGAAEMKAHVRLNDTGFVAELDDGRRFERADLLDLAGELHAAGVTAGNALYGDWRDGDQILMAGQKIALQVELRRLATNN